MSLTFKEIQDAVLEDAFDESKRSDAKNWIQFRHAWLWDIEDWQFKRGSATVTFPSGSQLVPDLPTDFFTAWALYDKYGDPVTGYDDPRQFFDGYNANVTPDESATPDAYTVFGGQMLIGPNGDGSTGILLYNKTRPTLVNDGDTTGLPDGYDLALVHGGKAEGFKLTNIPLSDAFDADFSAAVQTMRTAYLSTVREVGGQFGAYRPAQLPPWP